MHTTDYLLCNGGSEESARSTGSSYFGRRGGFFDWGGGSFFGRGGDSFFGRGGEFDWGSGYLFDWSGSGFLGRGGEFDGSGRYFFDWGGSRGSRRFGLGTKVDLRNTTKVSCG